MKDDVTFGEALAPAVAQESAALVVGELGKKGPFHDGIFPSPSRVVIEILPTTLGDVGKRSHTVTGGSFGAAPAS